MRMDGALTSLNNYLILVETAVRLVDCIDGIYRNDTIIIMQCPKLADVYI